MDDIEFTWSFLKALACFFSSSISRCLMIWKKSGQISKAAIDIIILYVNCKDETFSEKPTSGELQSRDFFFCDAPIVTTWCIHKNYDNDD